MMDAELITLGDGCRLAFRWDGPADAPVLMLSNSLGTDMGMWDPQIERWSADFRVLRYDHRGHGRSDVPPGAYSLDRLGRDAVELLDALGLDRVDFCGLSLGGMVGQWLGIREGQRLRRLVLANTSSRMGPPSAWDARIDLVRREGMAAVARASVERWFTQDFAASHADVIARIVAMLEATDPAGYAGCCAAIRDMDMRRTAALITVPTLVIGGTLDPATPPAHAQALASTVAGAGLTMLDAAHLANVECAQAFADAVCGFLL